MKGTKYYERRRKKMSVIQTCLCFLFVLLVCFALLSTIRYCFERGRTSGVEHVVESIEVGIEVLERGISELESINNERLHVVGTGIGRNIDINARGDERIQDGILRIEELLVRAREISSTNTTEVITEKHCDSCECVIRCGAL